MASKGEQDPSRVLLALMNCVDCSAKVYVKVSLQEKEHVVDATKKTFRCNKCTKTHKVVSTEKQKNEPNPSAMDTESTLKRKADTSEPDKVTPEVKLVKKSIVQSNQGQQILVKPLTEQKQEEKIVPKTPSVKPTYLKQDAKVIKMSLLKPKQEEAKVTKLPSDKLKQGEAKLLKMSLLKPRLEEVDALQKTLIVPKQDDDDVIKVITIAPEDAQDEQDEATMQAAERLIIQNESLLNQMVASCKGDQTVHIALVTDADLQQTASEDQDLHDVCDPVVGQVHSLLYVNSSNRLVKRINIRLSELKRRLAEPEKMSISTLIHYFRKSKGSGTVPDLKKFIQENNLPIHNRAGIISSFTKLSEEDVSKLVSDFLSLCACYLPTLKMAEQNAESHITAEEQKKRVSDLETSLRTVNEIQDQIQANGEVLNNVTHGALGLMTGVLTVVQEMLSQEKTILSDSLNVQDMLSEAKPVLSENLT